MIYCLKCNKPSSGKKQDCPHCGSTLPRQAAPKPKPKPVAKVPQEKAAQTAKPESRQQPAEARRAPKLIGEILIAAGMITRDQLQTALAQQKKLGHRLGEILVKENILTESQMVQALSHQTKIPWVDLWNLDIPKDLARLIPLHVVQKYRFVPMDVRPDKRGRKMLYLAMDNATDQAAIKAAESAAGMEIVPMFAGIGAIVASIQTIYRDQIALSVKSVPIVKLQAPPPAEEKGVGRETLSYVEDSVLSQQVAAAVNGRAAEIRWEDEAQTGFVVDEDREALLKELDALTDSAADTARLRAYLVALVEALMQKNIIFPQDLLKKLNGPEGGKKKKG